MRFVLMHQKNPDCVIQAVKKLLKAGGVAASQEGILGETYSNYAHTVLKEYRDTLMALGTYKGCDFNLGNKLTTLYEHAGFKHVEGYFKEHFLPISMAKKFIEMSLAEWKDKAIQAKLITPQHVDIWQKFLNELDENAPGFSFPQAYALAWK
jgi:hypothetical protein